MLTRSTEPYTAENGDVFSDVFSQSGFASVAIGANPLSDSVNTSANSIIATGVYNNGSGQNYPKIIFTPASKIEVARPVYVSLKYYKYSTGTVATGANSLWLMKNSTDANDIIYSYTNVPNDGKWKSSSRLIDFSKNGARPLDVTDIRLQINTMQADQYPSIMCFDDLSFIPAYKINYYSKDGSELLGSEYALLDSTGNFLTAFAPQNKVISGKIVTGWSTSINGAAAASVPLENADLNLYAVQQQDLFTSMTFSRNFLTSVGDTGTISITYNSEYNRAGQTSFASSNESVATVARVSDSKATVTAVSEGTATITATTGDGVSKSIDITVAFPKITSFDYTSADDAELKAWAAAAGTKAVFNWNDAENPRGTMTFTVPVATNYFTTPSTSKTNIDVSKYPWLVVRAKTPTSASIDAALYFKTSANSFVEAQKPTFVVAAGTTEFKDYYFNMAELYPTSWVGTDVRFMFQLGTANVPMEVDQIGFYPEFNTSCDVTLNSDGDYITKPGGQLALSANVLSDIYGVDKSVTWTLSDTSDIASIRTLSDGSAVVTAKVGVGKVTATATSVADPSSSASKDIFINVDPDKFAYYIDAQESLDATKLSAWGNSSAVRNPEFGTVTVTRITSDSQGAINVRGLTASSDYKYLVINAQSISGDPRVKVYFNCRVNGALVGMNETNTFTNLSFTQNLDGTYSIVVDLSQKSGYTGTAEAFMLVLTPLNASMELSSFYLAKEAPAAAKIGYKWDFENSAATGFGAGWGNHYQSTYSDGKANVVRSTTDNTGAVNNGGAITSAGITSSQISMTEYPYFCVVAKADVNMNVCFYHRYSVATDWLSPTLSFPASGEEYKTYVFNMLELDPSYTVDSHGYFDCMMFQLGTIGTMNVEEMYFANYNPNGGSEELDITVNLSASSSSITEDSGAITITPAVFSTGVLDDYGVKYTLNNSNAKIKVNDDGTATLTALANGTVIVTAASKQDPSVSSTLEITITGQREKIPTYVFNYYAIGNSYLSHGAFNGWQTTGSWGMAASEPSKDYFNRLQYYLTENFVSSINTQKINEASYERLCSTTATKETYTSSSFYAGMKNTLTTFMPNIITIQLAENIQTSDADALELFYDTLYEMVAANKPSDSIVVCMTPFGTGTMTDAIRANAAQYGFLVADMAFVGSAGSRYNNPYLAFSQYPEYEDAAAGGATEFRSHPGDVGHDTIAQKMYEQINGVISSVLTPDYIYLPETLTINGSDTITEKAGNSAYAVTADPSDSTNAVTWSVNDETVATISDAGVLTAVKNGSVTITAACVYDATKTTTKTVTITGQDPTFTVTYNAGTEDTSVTGLPANDTDARGTHTLSTVQPARTGYTFLGWALTAGGEVVTSINVTDNTTVYAVWSKADSWRFDHDGNFEGVTVGGFNTTVSGGIANSISYETGLAVYKNDLALSSDDYDTFAFNMLATSSESTKNLTVTITSTSGTYTYNADITTTGMAFYKFDISNVEGTITGMRIEPCMMECSISVDFIRFSRSSYAADTALTAVNVSDIGNELLANGNKLTIDTLTVNSASTLALGNGTYVIGSVSGSGTITASPNANVIITGETKPQGYTEIALGAKTADGNTRYAQINGETYKISENDNKYGIITSTPTVVTVTEKTADADVATVSSHYYYVDGNGTATELTNLSDSFSITNGAGIRTKTPTGMRFLASLALTAKTEETQFTVEEYGFLVAISAKLNASGKQLNLAYADCASGASFVKGSVDKVFDISDDAVMFSGVMTNIPSNHYTTKLAARAYTKIKIGGNTFTVYGEIVERSIYDVAKAVLANPNGLDAESLAVVQGIVNIVDASPDTQINVEELYK